MLFSRFSAKIHFLSLLVFALAFTACLPKSEQPTLSDEKLARIMADLHLADAATTGLTGFSKDSLSRVYADQVLDLHGITLEAYEQDVRKLAQDPAHMEKVMLASKALLEAQK